MSAKEQYKYAQQVYRNLKRIDLYDLKVFNWNLIHYHDYALSKLAGFRCDILMKAWQTL